MTKKKRILVLTFLFLLYPSLCPADGGGYHGGGKGSYKGGKGGYQDPKNYDKSKGGNVINIFQDDDDLDVNVNEDQTHKIMNIDSEGRTRDWEEMFHRMKKEFPAANIYAIIDGQSINKLIDLEALSNNTLLKITYLTHTGPKVLTVKVEDMDDLGIRSYRKNGVRIYMPDTNPPGDGL